MLPANAYLGRPNSPAAVAASLCNTIATTGYLVHETMKKRKKKISNHTVTWGYSHTAPIMKIYLRTHLFLENLPTRYRRDKYFIRSYYSFFFYLEVWTEVPRSILEARLPLWSEFSFFFFDAWIPSTTERPRPQKSGHPLARHLRFGPLPRSRDGVFIQISRLIGHSVDRGYKLWQMEGIQVLPPSAG